MLFTGMSRFGNFTYILRTRFLAALLIIGTASAASSQTDAAAAASGPLTRIAEIRQLSTAEASTAMPVHLNGLVLSTADPQGRALFLADEFASIYVLADQGVLNAYRRGDQLEVSGVTDPGEFAPIVRAFSARKLGQGQIPDPKRVGYYEVVTGSLDGQWIELDGVVRRVIPPEAGVGISRVMVAVDGGVLPVRTLNPLAETVQVDAEVRIQVICLYQFNQRRQVLSPVLQVPEEVPLLVTKPASENPFDAPIRPADSLMQFAADTPVGHRVHVRGIVTHAQPGGTVWIRDATSGLRLLTRQKQDIKIGDEIDVLGFPAYGSFTPVLEDAVYRKTGKVEPPRPVVIASTTEAAEHEDDLVQIEAAMLTDLQPVLDGVSLNLSAAGQGFKALLKLGEGEVGNFNCRPGSKVRVTGICLLSHEEPRPLMGIWQPQSFQLLIRTTDDVAILTEPPWWTTQRLTYVLAVAFGCLLLITGMIMLGTRRRLQEQALRRAMAETEFSAILNERNRVAREIHDTLAQGLAATAVHLRLAKKQNDDVTSRNHHLDVAQQLVSESLEEARNSIWNTRSQILETNDLPGALQGILGQMVDGTDLKSSVEVKGRARRLAPVIENNLLRIGQEAITNAVRHAQASHINVNLDFGERIFQFDVKDDGKGFDLNQPPRQSGGFGLLGMRERAREMKASLDVKSAPGHGTEIKLTLPLVGDVTGENAPDNGFTRTG